jgi:hypothetical protein
LKYNKGSLAVKQKIINVLSDEQGSAFIENMLWIALFVLVVAFAVSRLAGATTDVIQEMINKISAD